MHTRIMRCIGCLYIILTSLPAANAQILPGLEGAELEQALRDAYTPTILLDDTQLRDTLYAVVFLQDDSVHCVYSDYARYLPDGVDPSQHLFDNGSNATSINLEHGWPQSKGAGDGTMGNRNMHHLYPSRMVINSIRADFPFNEVVDQQAQSWYYLDDVMNSIPGTNIEAYSEFGSGHFEPREEFKGDIARAMFYFWTIYRNDAEQADPAFFEIQKDDLCTWHIEDPVDDFELLRDTRIASYQSGLSNPFILDCTLATRAYCPDQADCMTVSNEDPLIEGAWFQVDIQSMRIRLVTEKVDEWKFQVHNIMGVQIMKGDLITGNWFSVDQLSPGLYILVGEKEGKRICQKAFVP